MKSLLLLIVCTLCIHGVQSQSASYREHLFNTNKNVAISGYDPVSYFSDKAMKGNVQWKYSYLGITYFFINKDNLEKFKTDPTKYEPQYGGWCAYAIGDSGDKVKIDPETYKIKDGKLYLFYNFRGTNTLELWNKEEARLLKQAEANWAKIIE